MMVEIKSTIANATSNLIHIFNLPLQYAGTNYRRFLGAMEGLCAGNPLLILLETIIPAGNLMAVGLALIHSPTNSAWAALYIWCGLMGRCWPQSQLNQVKSWPN